MLIAGHGTGEGNFRGQRKESVLPCKDAGNSEYFDHYIPKVLLFYLDISQSLEPGI